MPRYFIQLSYKGNVYHGWQIQENAVSVQQIVDSKLSALLREKIETTGAGRTDTGVHAKYFIAHFDSITKNLAGNKDLVYHLNRVLPHDIAIQNIFLVKPDAHARYDALSRQYEYLISTKKNPFYHGSSMLYTLPLDLDAMNNTCKILKEYNDFTSFSKLHTDVKTNICNIYEAYWKKNGDLIIFTIKADRFLRNMVRAIVGTMMETGKNRIDTEGFRQVILAKNRGKAFSSADANGLYLTDIEYPASFGIK